MQVYSEVYPSLFNGFHSTKFAYAIVLLKYNFVHVNLQIIKISEADFQLRMIVFSSGLRWRIADFLYFGYKEGAY